MKTKNHAKYNYKPSKGVKIKGRSKTIPDDSMSVKDMLKRHVQGVLDPSQYHEGEYDEENIDHDTDVSHRQQTSLIDALDYANENAMSKDDIHDYLDTFPTKEEIIEDDNTPPPSEDPQE